MVEIPMESRIQIDQFIAQQAASIVMEKNVWNPKKQAREDARCRKPMNENEMESYALGWELMIVAGGNHSKHLFDPVTGNECSLCGHGARDYAPKTQKKIVDFIHKYGTPPIPMKAKI